MIDFTKPENYVTRCGAEFEIYNVKRGHGCVMLEDGSMVANWDTKGRFLSTLRSRGGYDLIPKPAKPIVIIIAIFKNHQRMLNLREYANFVFSDEFKYFLEVNVTDEDITTETIYRNEVAGK